MTSVEKVALVEKAKGIVEEQIDFWRGQFSIPVISDKLAARREHARRQLNSWLANQDTCKRHEAYKSPAYFNLVCSLCVDGFENPEPYPCPEAVTTADLIVNGVKE